MDPMVYSRESHWLALRFLPHEVPRMRWRREDSELSRAEAITAGRTFGDHRASFEVEPNTGRENHRNITKASFLFYLSCAQLILVDYVDWGLYSHGLPPGLIETRLCSVFLACRESCQITSRTTPRHSSVLKTVESLDLSSAIGNGLHSISKWVCLNVGYPLNLTINPQVPYEIGNDTILVHIYIYMIFHGFPIFLEPSKIIPNIPSLLGSAPTSGERAKAVSSVRAGGWPSHLQLLVAVSRIFVASKVVKSWGCRPVT